MKKIRSLAVINLLALLGHVTMAYLAQRGIFNGQSVGEVSDHFDSLFTPAGLTFAIWGVIYTSLLVFCFYHFRMALTHSPEHPANKNLQTLGIWFALNNLAAATWLLLWTYDWIQFSVVSIFFQLITLIIMHLRLKIHNPHASVESKIFTQYPLSIYFGWITIATIANTSVYLFSTGWAGFGLHYTPIEWARIMIGVAVFLTVIVTFSRRNVFFGLVVIWALYGIILKRRSIDASMYHELISTAWIGSAIIAISCVFQFIWNATAKDREITANSLPPVNKPAKDS
jgi:hypothetical protein